MGDSDSARIEFTSESILKFITEDLELKLEPWQDFYIQHYFDGRDGRRINPLVIAKPRTGGERHIWGYGDGRDINAELRPDKVHRRLDEYGRPRTR